MGKNKEGKQSSEVSVFSGVTVLCLERGWTQGKL